MSRRCGRASSAVRLHHHLHRAYCFASRRYSRQRTRWDPLLGSTCGARSFSLGVLFGVIMDRTQLSDLLTRVQRGEATVEHALDALKTLPFEDLGFARVDHHRALRKGFPEVILAQGKTARQIAEIAQRLVARGQHALITRLDEPKAQEVRATLPELRYYPDGRLGALGEPPVPPAGQGLILVNSVGTADLPVAEEAAVTAELLGNRVERLYDVGVAGLHRLLASVEKLH